MKRRTKLGPLGASLQKARPFYMNQDSHRETTDVVVRWHASHICIKLCYYVCMDLILDADGLIKLERAGLLAQVAQAFSCVIPDVVYDEVVTQGKARMYPDAEAIEEVVRQFISVKSQGQPHQNPLDEASLRLGAGEKAVLTLYSQEQEGVIVSDDRSFLSLLSRHNIPFLVPAALIVVMVRQGKLSYEAAKVALNRLRPWIREAVYHLATQDLEG